MGYVEDNHHSVYRAELDFHEISDDTMTDCGLSVGELEPIYSCALSPGHPSPVGRTEDGDLAYPVLPSETYMRLTRREIARLAHLLARDIGLTEVPKAPFDDPDTWLFQQLIEEAVPEVLFSSTSNHGQIEFHAAQRAVLEGRLEDLPANLLGG